MGCQVCSGALLKCSFGVAPSSLVILPTSGVMATMPAATMLDNKPIVNVPPFGMCQSPANPTVAAATAAALGVLTPMPCVPVCSAPWVPPSTKVMVGGVPAIGQDAKLLCNWGGMIEISSAGQTKSQLG